MIKEALSILITLVCAHQTVRIEIHDPATEFFTDFTEDCWNGGSSIGCGCSWNCIYFKTWQIISVPSGTPAWRYSTDV
jgi:hypothetical protein